MVSKHCSQEEKLTILQSAEELGVKKSAEIAGVHFTTVYDWRKDYNRLGKKAFLYYKPSYPGRNSKDIDNRDQQADQDSKVCDTLFPQSGNDDRHADIGIKAVTAL